MNKDKLTWKDLALMCFMTVWGFGNSINGFANFNGLGAVAFWIIVLVLLTQRLTPPSSLENVDPSSPTIKE